MVLAGETYEKIVATCSHGCHAVIVRLPYKVSRLPQDCRKKLQSFLRLPRGKHDFARHVHGVSAVAIKWRNYFLLARFGYFI